MATVKLAAKPREEKGTRASRALRAAGFIPANVFSDGQPSTLLKLDAPTWTKVLDEQPHLVMLKIARGGARLVTVKEIQRHPLTQEILHVDFQGVKSDQVIQFTVRVELVGTPQGVKDGGILSVSADHVEVQCLPVDVPDSLSHDISELNFGEGVAAGALELPESVKLVTDPGVVLASVVAVRITAEDAEVAAAEAAAAEAAEAALEDAEKEKKEEGEAPEDDTDKAKPRGKGKR